MRIFNTKNKILMASISEFLACVTQSGELLEKSIEAYLVSNTEQFSQSVKRIRDIEHEADEILERVKHDLYAFLLIPDTRSDVDRLLNALDDFIDATKQLLVLLSIERPHLPEAVVTSFRTISERTCLSSEHLAQASDAYFTYPQDVVNRVSQVIVCEKEVDSLQEEALDVLFNGIPSMNLAQKTHITRFLDLLCNLSDLCKDVGTDLMISALKRNS